LPLEGFSLDLDSLVRVEHTLHTFMRKLLHLKFLSSALLLVMLTVMINGVLESAHAHATSSNDTSVSGSIAHPGASATHGSPCNPLEQHQGCDGCDSCINCSCHAPFIIQPYQIGYDPIILDLSTSETFRHLPEVFLAKFIPPQNQA